MYNYAFETDVYKIWADMIAYGKSTKQLGTQQFCAFVGRRDGKSFVMDHDAIMAKYGSAMKMHRRLPPALASAMGDQIYIVTLQTQEEVDTYFCDLLEEQ
jgi:hypothetical protein